MSPPRRPDPAPMETDDIRIVALGAVLWLVALVAALVFHDRLADQGNGDWAGIAAAGLFLGFIGLRYTYRRQRGLRARPAAPPGPSAPGENGV